MNVTTDGDQRQDDHACVDKNGWEVKVKAILVWVRLMDEILNVGELAGTVCSEKWSAQCPSIVFRFGVFRYDSSLARFRVTIWSRV